MEHKYNNLDKIKSDINFLTISKINFYQNKIRFFFKNIIKF